MSDRPSSYVKATDGGAVRPLLLAVPNADGSITAPSSVKARSGEYVPVQAAYTVTADGSVTPGIGQDAVAVEATARAVATQTVKMGAASLPAAEFAASYPEWCYGASLTPGAANYDPARVLQGFLDFMEVQDFAGQRDLYGVWPGGEYLLNYEFTQAEWNRYADGTATAYDGWAASQAAVRKQLRMRSGVRLRFEPHAYMRSGALTTGRGGIFTNVSELQAFALVNAGTATRRDVPGDVEIEGGIWAKIDPLTQTGNRLGWISYGKTVLRRMVVTDYITGRAFTGFGDPSWDRRWEILECEARNPLGANTGGVRPLGGAWLVERCRMECIDDAYQAVGPNAVWNGTTHVAPNFTQFGQVIFRDSWGKTVADLMKASLPFQNGAPFPANGGPAPLTQSMPRVIFESITGTGGLTISNDGSSGTIGQVIVSRCEIDSSERQAINIAGAFGGVDSVELDVHILGVARNAIMVQGKVGSVRGRVVAVQPGDYIGALDTVQFWQTGDIDLDLDIQAPTTSSNGSTIGDIVTVGKSSPLSYIGQTFPAKAGNVRLALKVGSLVNSANAVKVNDAASIDIRDFKPRPVNQTNTTRGVVITSAFTGQAKFRRSDLSLLGGAKFNNLSSSSLLIDGESVGFGAQGEWVGTPSSAMTWKEGATLWRLTAAGTIVTIAPPAAGAPLLAILYTGTTGALTLDSAGSNISINRPIILGTGDVLLLQCVPSQTSTPWRVVSISRAGLLAQTRDILLKTAATDATPMRLTRDGTATIDAANAIQTRVGKTLRVRGTVMATQTGGTAGTAGHSATWDLDLRVSRVGGSWAVDAGGLTAAAPSSYRGSGNLWTLNAGLDASGFVDLTFTGEANKAIAAAADLRVIEN